MEDALLARSGGGRRRRVRAELGVARAAVGAALGARLEPQLFGRELGERQVGQEALHEVGVGHVHPAEGDGGRVAVADGLGRALALVAAVADQRAREDGRDVGEREGGAGAVEAVRVARAEPRGRVGELDVVDDVEVGDAEGGEGRGHVHERRHVVGRAHPVEARVGRDLDADAREREGGRRHAPEDLAHDREATLGVAAVPARAHAGVPTGACAWEDAHGHEHVCVCACASPAHLSVRWLEHDWRKVSSR